MASFLATSAMLARTRSSDPSISRTSVRVAGSRERITGASLEQQYRVGGGSPLPQAPRAKPVAADDLRGAFDGSGRVDEIDVIFLFAWLAAPVELPGSRPELGDIDDDDDVRQTLQDLTR